ncbi:MAG: bifunctional metallophosphatase/5'-nucleotidase [bacterium]
MKASLLPCGGARRLAAAALVAAVCTTSLGASPAAQARGDWFRDRPALTLTILHNNDGESSLLPTARDTDGDGVEDTLFGGIARFQRKVDVLRIHSFFGTWDPGESFKRAVVLLNSGDNYLPGTTFQASQQQDAPFFDGIAAALLRYDALAIGNHEFDFGPATLRRFVETVRNAPFVSANLDFSGEPALADLAGDRLVKSTIIRTRRERIGVVGLTTPSLPTISSPGGVIVLTDLAAAAQAEIDRLTDQGVKIIVLQSHLQGIESEKALVESLRNVDVVIGGGGDEVLADADTALFPGDADDVFGEYPQIAVDLDGNEVPVVTTPGNYRYVGQLQLTFDRQGRILSIDRDDSGIQLVTDRGPQAVGESFVQKILVEQPVAEFEAELAATLIGSSEIDLDCERSEVRGAESNCGNLIADAHLATARARAADFGLDSPQIGLQNGGGIRGEVDQLAGPISIADTFRLQPFGNFVAIAEDVPGETLRQIIEEGAIRLPASGDGGFVQVSAGTTLILDPSFPARVADQSTGVQLSPGERVRTLVLADGTVVVEDGVTRDVTVDVAALNFSLNGGDAYPAVPNVTVGVTDQQSLQGFIENELGGVVRAVDYPRGGEGRITIR